MVVERGEGGHNWWKEIIGYFHVSEHTDHFKAIKNYVKKTEIVWFGDSFGITRRYLHFFFIILNLRSSKMT